MFSGFVSVILPLIIYLYIEGGITDFLYDTVLWIFSQYRKFAAYPSYYFMGNMEIYKGFMENPIPLNLIRTRDWILIGYLPPITLLFSGLFGMRFIKDGKREIDNRKTIALIYIITGAFMFLSVLYRSDPVHITFIFPFIILPFCFLLSEWLYRSSGKWKIIPWALISLFLFYGLYGFYIRLKPLKNLNIPMQTKIGRLYGSDEKSVNDFRIFLDFIEDNAKGKNIFVYNCSSYLYILTGRENPTRYDCIIPGHYTKEQLLEVVSYLEKNSPEYVLNDNMVDAIIKDKEGMSYPMANLDDFINDPVTAYVRENYEPVLVGAAFEILKRRKLNKK